LFYFDFLEKIPFIFPILPEIFEPVFSLVPSEDFFIFIFENIPIILNGIPLIPFTSVSTDFVSFTSPFLNNLNFSGFFSFLLFGFFILRPTISP